MYQENLSEIEELVKSIRAKIEIIQEKDARYKRINRNFAMLLKALDAYSITPSALESQLERQASRQADRQLDTPGKRDTPAKKARTTERTPRATIEGLSYQKVIHREIALEIFDLLEKRGTVSLEDLVKGIKQTKYRVIEALNVLLKEKKILKSFNKGFEYRINEE